MVLKATDARTLIRRLLAEGKFVSPCAGTHARQEMGKDCLTDIDAVNVIRAGVVQEAEWENGSWRYRVETQRLVFVVTFDPFPYTMPSTPEEIEEMDLVVVTGWRK